MNKRATVYNFKKLCAFNIYFFFLLKRVTDERTFFFKKVIHCILCCLPEIEDLAKVDSAVVASGWFFETEQHNSC